MELLQTCEIQKLTIKKLHTCEKIFFLDHFSYNFKIMLDEHKTILIQTGILNGYCAMEKSLVSAYVRRDHTHLINLKVVF